MEILPQYNLTRFMAFIPTIRKSVEEWRIVEAIATGASSIENAATFEDGLRVQRVLDAARHSNAGGRVITL